MSVGFLTILHCNRLQLDVYEIVDQTSFKRASRVLVDPASSPLVATTSLDSPTDLDGMATQSSSVMTISSCSDHETGHERVMRRVSSSATVQSNDTLPTLDATAGQF